MSLYRCANINTQLKAKNERNKRGKQYSCVQGKFFIYKSVSAIFSSNLPSAREYVDRSLLLPKTTGLKSANIHCISSNGSLCSICQEGSLHPLTKNLVINHSIVTRSI